MARDPWMTPQNPIAAIRLTRWVKFLLISHSVAYILFVGLFSWAKWATAADLVLVAGQVHDGHIWRIVTYVATGSPTDPGTFLFDLLALFFFGPEMERTFGARRFLVFYFLTSTLAAALIVLTAFLAPGLAAAPYFGFQAPVVGLIVAFGIHYPDRQVLLLLWPVRARTLVLFTLGIIALYGFVRGPETVLLSAYGALVAWFLTTGNWNPRRAWLRLRAWRLRKKMHMVTERADKRYWN